MKRLKLVSIILLLGVIALCFCGCAESFTYRYIKNTSGGFSEEYFLRYDAEAEDADLVKEKAIYAMKNYIEGQDLKEYSTIRSDVEGEVSLIVSFATATDFALWKGETGREPNVPADTVEDGFFRYADFEIKSYLTEEKIRELEKLVGEEVPLSGKFYYVYGTPYRSIKSNGSVTEEDGIYYHTWELSPDEESDIKLRSYGLNGVLLYILAISIFVLSLVIIFVIIYIDKQKTKKTFARFKEDAAMHLDAVGRQKPDDKE